MFKLKKLVTALVILFVIASNANAAQVSAKELINSGYKPIQFGHDRGAFTIVLQKSKSYWYCWLIPGSPSICWEVQ